jgi:peptide-methionine (S)-S-oxide reductase
MNKLEKATFAAGCFWGVEEEFRTHKGVVETEVGYTGGHLDNATYEDTSSGTTGHAESVNVIFDPKVVSYKELVEFFFNLHDPTQVNKQGPDTGSQYRSAIFFHSSEQDRVARAVKEELEKSKKYSKPIATEIVPAGKFWRAEEYHQKYVLKTGRRVC